MLLQVEQLLHPFSQIPVVVLQVEQFWQLSTQVPLPSQVSQSAQVLTTVSFSQDSQFEVL